MGIKDKSIEYFCLIDDFCIEFDQVMEEYVLSVKTSKKRRNRKFKMSDSEVMTIMVLFHLGQFRNLKHFYINYLHKHMQSEFLHTVSYNRKYAAKHISRFQTKLTPLVFLEIIGGIKNDSEFLQPVPGNSGYFYNSVVIS